MVQGRAITTVLTVQSSANAIRDALYNAAVSIPYASRETNSFSVQVNKGSNFLEVTVQFETDRVQPFTLLRVYPVSLTGGLHSNEDVEWVHSNILLFSWYIMVYCPRMEPKSCCESHSGALTFSSRRLQSVHGPR